MKMNVHNSSSSSPEAQDPPRTRKKSRGGWRAIKYILGNESFEKLASMSLIANMTVYLTTKYNLSTLFTVNVVNIWNGSSNVVSLAGAFISDTYLGRFRTLLCGCISSLIGMAIITLTAGIHSLRPSHGCNDRTHDCPQPNHWQLAILFIGLGFLSIGAGGIRPCNIAFGADQFDTRTAKGSAQLESFFNWWYFSFTIALIIALTGVVYIQTNISWLIGFAIPTTCLAFSIFIFLCGRHTYIYINPQGSIFSDVAKVVVAACRKSRLTVARDSEPEFYDPPLVDNGSERQAAIKYPHTNRFKFLDRAAIIRNANEELDNLGKPKSGWRLCSIQQVEQLKFLGAILPVWVTAIGTFITQDQTNTFGVLQALQMNRAIGPKFKFPPGWMSITSMIALATWILIYERIYLPIAKKLSTSKSTTDLRFTMQQRINAGITLSIVTMVVSGLVEEHRRRTALKLDSYISPISFAWLLPQYFLTGLTESFSAVAIMELFTMQMPQSMRTVAGAIFFLSLSVSNYLGSLVVNIVNKATEGKSPWVGGHDLNKNKLDCYYFIIAGLGALNLIYFNVFAKHYVLVDKMAGDDAAGKGEAQLELQQNPISRDTANDDNKV